MWVINRCDDGLSGRARPARLPLLSHPPSKQVKNRLYRFAITTDQLVLQTRRRKPCEQHVMHGFVGRAVRLIWVLNARCHSLDFIATACGRRERTAPGDCDRRAARQSLGEPSARHDYLGSKSAVRLAFPSFIVVMCCTASRRLITTLHRYPRSRDAPDWSPLHMR